MTEDAKRQKSQAGGNNQTPAFECRKYVFTINNYKDEDIKSIKSYLSTKASKFVFGEEVGESGTPHLQGYMEFKNSTKWSTLCNGCEAFKRAWATKAKGSLNNNYAYTSKDGKFHYGGFEPKKVNYKEDIEEFYEWEKEILNIIANPPDKRSIHYFWEEAGCAGKTTFQKYLFTHYPNVVVLSGKATDMKNGIVQYMNGGKETPDIVLINIPRCSQDFVSWEGIESIKDMFFFSGKYEGGMVCGMCPHVLVFANEPPNLSKLSDDRWVVREI